MTKSIEEIERQLEDIINFLNTNKNEKVYITKNGRNVAVLTGISSESKRIGIAKEEMKGRSITLEELNSINTSNLF